MSHSICVISFKGGVGKTTTTVNLAVAFALLGRKVLVVDCDPQASASACFLFDRKRCPHSLSALLMDKAPLKQVVFPSGIKNLHFVAAHSDLHAAELALATRKGYSCELLQKKLSPLQSEYDYIFFDTHPCLGPLTTNAIRASNFLLVPLQCAYLAYDALPHMMKMLTDIKLRLHPPLLLLGLLMTMMDKGETFPLVMQEKVTQHFGRLAFKNVVPRDPQMQGASGKELLPVLQRPRSPVAAAYRRLAQEIEERIVYINQMETAKGAP